MSNRADAMRFVAVVPVYNHGAAIGAVVDGLRDVGLPVLLVDDGSAADCAAVLDDLAARHPDVRLVRLAVNSGKGGAMIAGLRAAAAAGYSHALQIDADGQHDTTEAPAFLAAARDHPEALITAYPVYDDSVPKGRLYGRYLTHVWVWINTLSFAITDSMCGYRVYPLAATIALLDAVRLRLRMEFDVEVLVHWHWRGGRIVNRPAKVRYPSDGVSHFRVFADNVLISKMHARLFFGMLWRLPILLWRRVAG